MLVQPYLFFEGRCEEALEFYKKTLGAKVDAPTPEGVVSLTVPKGSNSGTALRLKGRGAIDPATNRRGDLFARLIVTLPDKPDAELEKFAEVWRKERPYSPRRK